MDPHNRYGDPMTRNRRVVDNVTISQNPAVVDNNIGTEADVNPIVEYADEPLLPLVDACTPLVDIINDLMIYVQRALNATPQVPSDELTFNESASIRLYTMEWEEPQQSLYFLLNLSLESADRNDLRPYSKYLKLLLTALVKIPCIPQQTIWRGIKTDLNEDFPRGKSVIWWKFSSCTTTMTVLNNNTYLGDHGPRTLFSIDAINGRMIRAHSHFADEDEILLLPGTQMVVQSQLNPAPDLHIIHLKQMVPKKSLLKPPFEGTLNIFNRFFETKVFFLLGAQLYSKTSLLQNRPYYRKKRLIIPISLLAIALIAAAAVAIYFFILKPQDSIKDLSADLNSTRVAHYMPGLSALVMKNGRIIAQGVAGYRRQDDPTALLLDDPVNIGGCTEWMTATLAGRLVDQRRISWTTRVNECFPNYESFNSAFHNTTLEEFLANVSGMEDDDTFESRHSDDFLLQNGSFSQIRHWAAEAAMKDPPQFQPGTFWPSNLGYAVAAAMMEIRTGKDWESLMHEHVFTPLDMSNTTTFGIVYNDSIPPEKPVGHDLYPNSTVPVPSLIPNTTYLHNDRAASGPCCYVICTLEDWAKFLRAHITAENNGYLTKETVTKLTRPFTSDTGNGLGVGVGDTLWARPGKELFNSGYIFGQDSFFIVGSSQDLVVVVYTNSHRSDETDYNPTLNDLAVTLASKYGG